MYFQFAYGFDKMGIGVTIGECLKEDLVGYGYDAAPKLRYFKIRILFIAITAGSLSIPQ